MKRGGPFKRRRRRPQISYENFWRTVTSDGTAPCELEGVEVRSKETGLLLVSCGGPVDAHHHFPKRRIFNQLGRYSEAARLAVTDVRNGVCLCRNHHEAVEGGGIESPEPGLFHFFLIEHKLFVPDSMSTGEQILRDSEPVDDPTPGSCEGDPSR